MSASGIQLMITIARTKNVPLNFRTRKPYLQGTEIFEFDKGLLL